MPELNLIHQTAAVVLNGLSIERQCILHHSLRPHISNNSSTAEAWLSIRVSSCQKPRKPCGGKVTVLTMVWTIHPRSAHL